MSRPAIVIAGGGTGGHVFPAIAVAEAMRRMAAVDVVFCGTRRGVEARAVPERGFVLELLDVDPIKGRSTLKAARAAAVAAIATGRAVSLLRRRRPRAVMGVGGYASGPVALAAALSGVPLALLEPNQVVGFTNRLLAPLARRAYVSSEGVGLRFRRAARRPFGVPLRDGFAPTAYVASGRARVLVMGGSQGASALNARMPEAIAQARTAVPAIEVLHQAGRGRDAAVRAEYARRGIDRATVVPFVDDVAGAIASCDLVVSRAGAGTIAEVTAIGRAALLVPLPHAADNHQQRNAEALDRAGAASWLPEGQADAARLAAAIERVLLDGAARTAMADASRALGRPGAAGDVAADLLALAGVTAAAAKEGM